MFIFFSLLGPPGILILGESGAIPRKKPAKLLLFSELTKYFGKKMQNFLLF